MTRYYEQVELGDEIDSVDKVATDEAVADFCVAWGSPGAPRFTDHEASRKDGLPGAIVPGIMSMAYMAQFLSHWAEGGSVKKLDVVFRQPVPHEPLRLVGVVTDKNQVGGENQVECDVYIETPDGNRLVGGKSTVVLPSKE